MLSLWRSRHAYCSSSQHTDAIPIVSSCANTVNCQARRTQDEYLQNRGGGMDSRRMHPHFHRCTTRSSARSSVVYLRRHGYERDRIHWHDVVLPAHGLLCHQAGDFGRQVRLWPPAGVAALLLAHHPASGYRCQQSRAPGYWRVDSCCRP